MFIGLIAPLEEDQRIPVSLNFERAGMIETSFDIGSLGAKGPRTAECLDGACRDGDSAGATRGDRRTFLHSHCGTRVMANITVSPGRSGPVDVLVQIEDGDEKPLAVVRFP